MKTLIELMWAFHRPTYQLVEVFEPTGNEIEKRLDRELRLYLPRRVPIDQMHTWITFGKMIQAHLSITGPVQFELNRSGMCLCFSCGREDKPGVFEAVNRIRQGQGLRPIKP